LAFTMRAPSHLDPSREATGSANLALEMFQLHKRSNKKNGRNLLTLLLDN
jgi:hypothetical protein